MDKTDSKPVSDKELEEESDIEEVIEKDGAGYGDSQSLNAQPDDWKMTDRFLGFRYELYGNVINTNLETSILSLIISFFLF